MTSDLAALVEKLRSCYVPREAEQYVEHQLLRMIHEAAAAIESLAAENAAWLQVWDNVRLDKPDLREDNKPLAVAASYALLKIRAERAEAKIKTLEGLVSQGIASEHAALGKLYGVEAERDLQETSARKYRDERDALIADLANYQERDSRANTENEELRDALTRARDAISTLSLAAPGYDWNADARGLTLLIGETFAAIDAAIAQEGKP